MGRSMHGSGATDDLRRLRRTVGQQPGELFRWKLPDVHACGVWRPLRQVLVKGLQPSAAREFMSRAGLAGLLAYAPVLHGCGASADPANECAAATRMAIYFGSQDAGRLELSASERAAIGLVMPVTGDALCTGVVLPRGWVLTARHCDAGVPLLFGSSDASAGRIAVTSTKQHPEYDVMLLELGGREKRVTGTQTGRRE